MDKNGDMVLSGDREFNIFESEATMDLVREAIKAKPELEQKYKEELPHFNTVSIRNQLSVTAWDLIMDGLER